MGTPPCVVFLSEKCNFFMEHFCHTNCYQKYAHKELFQTDKPLFLPTNNSDLQACNIYSQNQIRQHIRREPVQKMFSMNLKENFLVPTLVRFRSMTIRGKDDLGVCVSAYLNSMGWCSCYQPLVYQAQTVS